MPAMFIIRITTVPWKIDHAILHFHYFCHAVSSKRLHAEGHIRAYLMLITDSTIVISVFAEMLSLIGRLIVLG